jgi:alkylhydroperoxidase family enzyme
MDIGSAVGRASGVTEEQLRELPRYRESEAFTPLEKAVIDFAVVMTETPVEMPEPLFAELSQHFDAEQMVELTAAVAWENFRARFNHALGVESQGYSEGAFCVLPERPARDR